MTLKPKKLFLLDSLGALMTAFLLGVILASFEETFGMPRDVLYFLAAIAVLYAIYSFLCHKLITKNWGPYLRAIAVANLAYCCITMGLVMYFYSELTILGLAYFFGEMLIIIGLVAIEFKVSSVPSDKKAIKAVSG